MLGYYGKKSQYLIANAIFLFMLGIIIYFGIILIYPIITSSWTGISDSIKTIEMLYIPLLIICFGILIFKVFRSGEGG